MARWPETRCFAASARLPSSRAILGRRLRTGALFARPLCASSSAVARTWACRSGARWGVGHGRRIARIPRRSWSPWPRHRTAFASAATATPRSWPKASRRSSRSRSCPSGSRENATSERSSVAVEPSVSKRSRALTRLLPSFFVPRSFSWTTCARPVQPSKPRRAP